MHDVPAAFAAKHKNEVPKYVTFELPNGHKTHVKYNNWDREFSGVADFFGIFPFESQW